MKPLPSRSSTQMLKENFFSEWSLIDSISVLKNSTKSLFKPWVAMT